MLIVLKKNRNFNRKKALKSESSEHILRQIFRTRNREVVMLDLVLEIHSAVFRFLIIIFCGHRRKVNPCIQSSTIKSTNYLFLSRFLEISLAFFREVTIKITSFRYQLFIFLVEVRKKKSFFFSTRRKRNRDTINIIFYVIFQSESVKSRLLYYSDASEKSFEDKLSIETKQIAQSE